MSEIRFIGPKVDIERVVTPFWSLNQATKNNRGEIGWTVPSYTEIYGKEGVGKTNAAVYIGGILAAALKKDVAFLDLEIQDMDTVAQILSNGGFQGTVRLIREETDEGCLDSLISTVKDEHYSVGIMDSIAAISPIAEQTGDIGDANMGRRAINMAQFSRKAIRLMQRRESPYAMLCTNHRHAEMGSRVGGSETVGGVTHRYMSTYRIHLKNLYYKKRYIRYSNGWVLEGVLEKSRTGYAFSKFYVYMMAGEGLHPGISAMWDCILHDYAEYGRSIKMDGETFGSAKKLIENEKDNPEVWLPFINKLREVDATAKEKEEDYEYEPVEEQEEEDVSE